MMPFTVEQFLAVFSAYNEAVWPAQLVLVGLALIAVGLIVADRARETRLVGMLLAALWFWSGVAYHLAFFAAINRAALAFGALFVVQGALLAWDGVSRRRSFHIHATTSGAVGSALVVYALIAYPLIGLASGQRYPAMPTFGAPCPTTIFTFGVLLWSEEPIPVRLLVIPALWSLVGASAAVSLGIVEDHGLLIAGVVAMLILARRHATERRTAGTRPRAAADTPRRAWSSAGRPR